MNTYLLYHTDDGTDVLPYDWEKISAVDFLMEKLMEFGHNKLDVTVFDVYSYPNGKLSAERIYPYDDYDEDESPE